MKVRTRKHMGMEGGNRENFFPVKEEPLSLEESGPQNSFGWEHPALHPVGPRHLRELFLKELMFGGINDS